MQVRDVACLLLTTGFFVATPAFAQDPPPAPETPQEAVTAAPAAEPAASAPADAPAPAAVAPAPAAPAAPVVPAEPVFTGAKQIEVSTSRISKDEADVAFLPHLQLHWAVRSQTTASGGVFNKHKSRKEIFAPMDQQVLERVLLALQDDLAARFEAAGWQAQTRAELGADLPVLKTLQPDKELGVPLFKYNDTITESDWALITLPGAGAPDPKSIGAGMAWNRYLKGKSGVNINLTYSFAPGTVEETKSRQLATEAGSGLWFSARADLISAKGGWGNINVVPSGLVVDSDIGALAEIDGSKAGKAENVIRFMSGMGTRDRTGYTMTPDWDKAEAAMLRAGRAFNAEVVSRLAP